MFSDTYLKQVGRNLALGIYTAVANPISLEGRHLLCSSTLLHEDLSEKVGTLDVPIILMQSTEDLLVNPANVDPFLRGRGTVHHFWSHEFKGQGGDGSEGNGVGKAASGGAGKVVTSSATSSSPLVSSSVYGRKGLTDILRALSKPMGTFVVWVRSGHEVRQEAKAALIDLLDVLAKPTPEHVGIESSQVLGGSEGTLGLCPSSDFVARISGRLGSRHKGATGDNVSSTTAEDLTIRGRKDQNLSQDIVDASIPVECAKKRRRVPRRAKQENGIHGEDETLVTGKVATMDADITSPFPQDLSIPALPARIGNRAPNTSPIKRSRAAASVAATTYNDTNAACEYGFPCAGGNLWERETSRPRGGRRKSGSPVSSRSARGGIPVRDTGGRRGKVAWCRQPAVAQAFEGERDDSTASAALSGDQEMAGPNGPEQVNLNSHHARPVLSHFPDVPGHHASALLAAPCAEEMDEPQSLRSALDLSILGGSRAESVGKDPWDLIDPTRSVELITSDPLQRGRRRWVESAEQDDTLSANSSPKPARKIAGANGKVTAVAVAVVEDKAGSIDGRGVASVDDLLEAEVCLENRLREARQESAQRVKAEEAAAEQRIAGIHREQAARRAKFAEEDKAILAELEAELASARRTNAHDDLQRAVNYANVDDAVVRAGLASPSSIRPLDAPLADRRVAGIGAPARAMPPIDYSPMEELPGELTRATDAYSMMDDAARDEVELLRLRKEAARGAEGGCLGRIDLEKFQRDQLGIVSSAAAKHFAAKKAYRGLSDEDVQSAKVQAALRFQPIARGYLGRKRALKLRCARDLLEERQKAAVGIQTVARGRLARQRGRRAREAAMAEIVFGGSALRLQSAGRGMLARRRATLRRRQVSAKNIQRCYRGHLGRRCAARERALLDALRARHRSAIRLQSWWRCRAATGGYARVRAHSLAAVEIQRVFRGVIGRRKARRRLEWEQAAPGPTRLKLGMRMIEDTKVWALGSLSTASMHVYP